MHLSMQIGQKLSGNKLQYILYAVLSHIKLFPINKIVASENAEWLLSLENH